MARRLDRVQFLQVLALYPMATDDFSRIHLDTRIDLRQTLAVLTICMPWAENRGLEVSRSRWLEALMHKDRTGRVVQNAHHF